MAPNDREAERPDPAKDDEPGLRRTVDASAAGRRLDAFLAAQPEVASRSRARRLLDEHCVRVHGPQGEERVRPALTLEAGQVVTFLPHLPGETSEVVDLSQVAIPLLYEDPHLVVIDKPPTLAAHPARVARGPVEATVSGWFAAREHARAGGSAELPSPPGENRPGIVHRLDRQTSGVMVLARSRLAFDGLRAQFKARTVEKEYRALSYGEPRFDSDWIDKPLMPNPRQGDRMVVVRPGEKDPRAKEASTFYEVVERFDGFTWFCCRPRTGRTHQIRVHLTSIGHSLVGDRAYRSRNRQGDALPDGAPDPGRHCLHAFRLRLRHPLTAEPLEFEAPVPRDIGALLDWLRAHRAAG